MSPNSNLIRYAQDDSAAPPDYGSYGSGNGNGNGAYGGPDYDGQESDPLIDQFNVKDGAIIPLLQVIKKFQY